VAGENRVTLGGNDLAVENRTLFGGYFCRSRQKFQNHRKLFGLSFGGLCIATKIITGLFSAVFPSHRNLLCNRGSTHPISILYQF
jgi:hypothetical protein